ncbi:Peptidoglycan glycosyltransferase [Chthoniobacter flavus Ellin428]|uniref:Peptidoglycan glycosyltransferase n=1 Tax=Chthoniobacter flavus Ellin428 TaxID=497964 RepID=B4CY12_9BACT|nr:PBP1A family penicillin-binding protein [Chthoniobacter flavus]EDY21160.1 Peptidoglycan glycosyltransferase [Chthoniobacter flavus Ellin428]TCO87532.1 penicillin-binding protein 1A [Chthoniobacter flavus]
MKARLRTLLKITAWTTAVAVILVATVGVVGLKVYSDYVERADQFDLTKIDGLPERSAVYDSRGNLYGYFGGENRLSVPLDKVSLFFVNALLAREDNRFWEHHGVDTQGVLRAFLTNLRAGETRQGGSTITQQLARNACGLVKRSLDRKALEAVLARRIEEKYPKEKILEMYVNRIYFGSGFYGIEAASRGYFGKPATDLTLGEAATLAALIRSPRRLSPARDLDAASQARNDVLSRMAELKMISSDEATAAEAQQLQVASHNAMHVTDDAIMEAVEGELSTLLSPDTLEYGGLKVTMTIDPALQRLAQTAADRRLSEIESHKGYPHPRKADFVPDPKAEQEKPTNYLQAAVVMIDNRTGAIKAAVGGRDYAQSKYSRALLGKRQIGSTFKPFVYAAAFDRGLMPGTFVDDGKIAAGEYPDIPKKWSPANSDGHYGGLEPASYGLVHSRNTMSVRVGEFAGLPMIRGLAQKVGLSDNVPEYPVVFLGAFETTARNLTSAYTIFPNGGVYRPSYLIAKVEDRDGHVLYQPPHAEKRIISSDTAAMVTGILQQVMKHGTAAKAASLGWKKNGAGKTGTTNDFFDAWFVGYTSSLTCGVWVGMDKPQTIMEKGYGAALALPIWVDVMREAPENEYPTAPLNEGVKMAKVTLCAVSGKLATAGCAEQHYAYQVELPASRVPKEYCQTHPEMTPPIAAEPTYPSATPSGQAAPYPTSNPPMYPSGTTYPASSTGTAVTAIRPPATSNSPSIAFGGRPLSRPAPAPIIGEAGGPSTQYPARTVYPPATASTRMEPPSVAEPVTTGPVEVRRAIPVTRSTEPRTSSSTTPSTLPPGVTEQRIVTRTPDGRIHTTIIRTTHGGRGYRTSIRSAQDGEE